MIVTTTKTGQKIVSFREKNKKQGVKDLQLAQERLKYARANLLDARKNLEQYPAYKINGIEVMIPSLVERIERLIEEINE